MLNLFAERSEEVIDLTKIIFFFFLRIEKYFDYKARKSIFRYL